MSRRVAQQDVVVKLIVGAGQASPSPPVGPALGSKGVKSMDFCKEFNARTANYKPGTPIPARVTVRPDRSFHFELRTPPTSTLLLSAARVAPIKGKLRGAGNVGGPVKLAAAAAALSSPSSSPFSSSTSTTANASTPADANANAKAKAGAGVGTAASAGAGAGAGSETEGLSAAESIAGGAASVSGKAAVGGAGMSSVAVVGQPVSLKHVFEIARIKQGETRLAGIPLEALARSVVAQAASIGVLVVP